MNNFFKSLFLLFLLISCSGKNEREFSFAVSGEFKPFSFIDPEGNLTGFDVEVGKLIAKELSKDAAPVKYKFAGIIEGLKSGRFDAAVASHTITEERAKHVNFSLPYYYSGPQVFSRQDSEKVKISDLEIAVSKGSTYQDMAKNYTAKIKIYDSDITALEALSRGHHDLVITDAVTGSMAKKNGLKIFQNQSLGKSKQGIAISKENDKLLKRINKALEKLKKNGSLSKLSQKYFSSDITNEKI